MSRRQPSTTSLSKYARANSPILEKPTDFCNAFWGPADAGVDVLFARMRGAQRTVDELRNYWKERSVIEEDYAKRLAKLSKVTLGRDEIGELRNSFDTVRSETDRQSGFHLHLASQIRELENKAATFLNRQVHHRKVVQTGIEKEFKAKQTQEAYVNKAREKYEADCLRINSYTAQSTLVQGKDLEKVQLKLERAQQTVHQNERDFANFAKALADTTHKWEQDWKVFCDMCQDLEEGRLEFLRDNLWAYANSVSTVCVSDDESCEKIRVALEQMDAIKEMENFVLDYGTGNMIPDPPGFINYNSPDAVSASSQQSVRPARFMRSSTRPPRQQSPPAEEPEPSINTAGVGAGGGTWTATPQASLSRAATQTKARAAAQAGQNAQPNGTYENGSSEHPSNMQNLSRRPTSVSPQPVESPAHQTATAARSQHIQPSRQSSVRPTSVSPQPVSRPSSSRPTSVSPQPPMQPQQAAKIPHDPHAEPIAPNAETYIKVGQNAYKVDLSKDPQQQSGSTMSKASGTQASSVLSLSPAGADPSVDPLAKQMEELKRAVSNSGSVRRRETKPAQTSPQKTSSIPAPSPLSAHGSNSVSPVGGAPPVRDYRNSAEVVVGAYPTSSRSASPKPPTAEFMHPQHSGISPGADVERVVADYQQSLPGEHKSVSRRGSYMGPPPSGPPSNAGHSHSLSLGQNVSRPPSVGHAGIGAHGSRSNSPQPPSRGPSPGPGPGPGPGVSPSRTYMSPSQALALSRANSIAQPQRAVSPNQVGIALDPSGRVMHDEMAQRYQQQRQPAQAQPQQQQQQQQQAPPSQQPYNPQQRRASYMGPGNPGMPPQGHTGYAAPPPPQPPYAGPPPTLYQAPPAAQQSFGQPSYTPAPYQPPTQTPGPYQQPPSQTPGPYQQPPTQTPGPYQQPPSQTPGPYQQPPSQTPAPYQPPPTQTPAPYQQPPPHQGGYPQQQQPQQAYYQNGHRGSMSLSSQQMQAYRTPSPQPPPPPPQQAPQQQQPQQQASGQATEDGQPILFYVKALYDYVATIDEEFDFQTGDIIAVTATPEDGWWSGELLDERRRQRGRHIFPSNFVCLF